jgi:hypothetical protein
MAIYFQPPPPFIGGRQPYAASLGTAVEVTTTPVLVQAAYTPNAQVTGTVNGGTISVTFGV